MTGAYIKPVHLNQPVFWIIVIAFLVCHRLIQAM